MIMVIRYESYATYHLIGAALSIVYDHFKTQGIFNNNYCIYPCMS